MSTACQYHVPRGTFRVSVSNQNEGSMLFTNDLIKIHCGLNEMKPTSGTKFIYTLTRSHVDDTDWSSAQKETRLTEETPDVYLT